MVDFDVAGFMRNHSDAPPRIGLAFSGGGYRAMLNGAGAFAAFDARTTNSTKPGNIGGLVQASTYIAGLSGGSWMLASLFVNNFTTVRDLQGEDDGLWDLENSILAPEGRWAVIDTAGYYGELRDEVTGKRDAGYGTSLTDYWGRALSRQFIGGRDGGAAVTYSSISDTDTFKNHEMPFPIIVANGRHPGEIIIAANATVFEFSPLEMGSHDPSLYAFTPTRYLGSNVTNGVPVNSSSCTRGFDNAGFILGTSSSLFNIGLLQLENTGLTGILRDFAVDVLQGLAEADADIARYTPNPFYKYRDNPWADDRDLTLVDGGLDGQNVPLHPLIQPNREVDVIFAVDASADNVETNWPNGTSLIATYERALDERQSNHTMFPAVPDANTFVNLGLNTRPTFFGCDARNITTDENQPIPPLIVYLPNHPISYLSNFTTFTMAYTQEERDQIIENGYDVATRANSTLDEEWPACAACAVVRRAQERKGEAQTEQCARCFDRYCWDGTLNSTAPGEQGTNYTVLFADKESGGERGRRPWSLGAFLAATVGGWWLM